VIKQVRKALLYIALFCYALLVTTHLFLEEEKADSFLMPLGGAAILTYFLFLIMTLMRNLKELSVFQSWFVSGGFIIVFGSIVFVEENIVDHTLFIEGLKFLFGFFILAGVFIAAIGYLKERFWRSK